MGRGRHRPVVVATRVSPRTSTPAGADAAAREEPLAECLAEILLRELRSRSTTTVHSGRGTNRRENGGDTPKQ